MLTTSNEQTCMLLAAAILSLYDDNFVPKNRDEVIDLLRCIKDHGYYIVNEEEDKDA